ncbi:MAG: TonB-dependent receptor, partial [Ramlibacter sp.]|nr:TonB-dependent receptor [Ramlibacter sp.]
PETAKSYTLGAILEPMPGTNATIDFWRIKRKNEIVQADPAAIIGGASPTSTPLDKQPGAQPGSFIYYDVDGNIATVTGFYRNASSTNTNGFDVELRHKMNLGGGWGKLSAQVNWTHVNRFSRTDADGNTFEYAGTHGPIALSSGSGTPKDRASFSLTLDKGPWTWTGMANYVGPLKLIDHKGEMAQDQGDGTVVDQANGLIWNWDGTSSLACGAFTTAGKPWNGNCKLPSFITYDIYAKWTPMKNLDINLSIQNVFNKMPPLDPYLVLSYGSNYNQGWHQSGAVGRYYTLGARYTF